MPSTKDAILDSAEALFAEQGFAQTSLRAITGQAGVNLAAVNYHFGSKDALIEALLARRVQPMNAERIRRLRALQLAHPNAPVAVEDLVRAFVAPALEMSRNEAAGGHRFIRLLGRSYTEPLPRVHSQLRSMYARVVGQFKAAFAEALPELDQRELNWRMHFMVGLLAYLMAGTDTIRMISSSCFVELENESLLDHLQHFVTAGMRAPALTADTVRVKLAYGG